jgi:hypothetical protein
MPVKKSKAGVLPAEVVYYNRWTDFRNKEIGSLFECIPHKEVLKLKKGETIWVDSEQPSGKVYGYSRAEIVSVEDDGDHIILRYKGPYIEGVSGIEKKDRWHRVHRCTNTSKLLELVKASPLALETGTVRTISDVSRKYLEGIGATIVPV